MNKRLKLALQPILLIILAGSITAIPLLNKIEDYKSSALELHEKIDQLEKEVEEKDFSLQEKNNIVDGLTEEKDTLQKSLEALEEKYKKEITPVSFNSSNLRSASNATARKLSFVLKGTGLEGLENSYVQAEKEYGVNAIFLCALTAEESGWGRSRRAREQNNISGFEVYSDGARGAYFSSKHESIMTTARLLDKHYLTPTGMYFNGYSIQAVNTKYCATGFQWSKNISSIANNITERINSQL